MLLITDANSLFSFFRKESSIRELVINSDEYGLTLAAPKRLFIELDKHKSKICELAEISEDEYEFPRAVIEVFIKIIPDEFWKDFISETDEILKQHTKDVPYVALALAFKSKGEQPSILSNESRFKVLEEHGIKVFKTRQLFKYLRSLGYDFWLAKLLE